MTTELEIIDTAVKVGLGAAISGATTYLVTMRAHKHEVRKELRKEQTELLKKGAAQFESSGALINHALRLFENLKFGDSDVSGQFNAEINSEFTNAFNEAREARMLFHLIGNTALADAATNHMEAMEALRKHLMINGVDADKTFLKTNNEKRMKARDSFLGALSNALAALHA
ncbi:MAG: hypothetical protein K1X67_19165 [Fimbriimonadaceae bacterium]|nr:hypothetical protein [Fimbriimonadaceae bacterium]